MTPSEELLAPDVPLDGHSALWVQAVQADGFYMLLGLSC